MTSDLLLTRDEVLGGLPARRAASLLFLIESRTAHLVENSRRIMTSCRTEDATREREMAFVEAFSLGREPPWRPTIQDLERHAAQWAALVPDNARMRAAVAHALGQKYEFAASDVPELRATLGLDDAAVQQAYHRLYQEPLDTIFTKRPSLVNRARWARASLGGRLDSLPPFWIAFALTLTETVGAGVLALPIALAAVGPLPGIILLIVIGLVNVITVAWMAEVAVRTACVRYGRAYFGRLVTEYLGSAGSALLTVALVIISATFLLAYAIGLSTTLASATGVAAAVWIPLLFVVVTYMVSRDAIHSTVASALGIGALNLVLLLVLAAIGLMHVSSANLGQMHVPGLGGQPFELSFVGLVFGVVLMSYFGHTSVGNCAAVVLQRDSSGRSLIWGAIMAQIVAIALYSIWVLSINGAIASESLAGHAGTALEPLAAVGGSSVYVVGSIFVVLAMGMGSIHRGLTLVNVVRERIPRRSRPVVVLRRGQGRLVFEPRGSLDDHAPRVVLTYLGQTSEGPRFRLQAQAAGRTQRVDKTGAGLWTAREMLDHLPDDVRDELDLMVEVLTTDEEQAQLQVDSRMRMSYEGLWTTTGLDLVSLLDVADGTSEADPDAALLRWMLRQGQVSLEAAAAWAGQDEREMQARLRTLVERGTVREVQGNGAVGYRASVAHRRARHLPDRLQQATEGLSRSSRHDALAGSIARVRLAVGSFLSDRGSRILEYSPLVIILLLTEWLILTDRGSFTQVLSFSGVIAVPIFAGIFPCLMLVSSRRKGDLVPGLVPRVLGQPWLTSGIYAFYLAGILVHVIIWQRPVERVAALVAGIAVVWVTVLAVRRGAFKRRTVVTLRDDRRPGGKAEFEIVSCGSRFVAEAELVYADGFRYIRANLDGAPDFAALRQIIANLPADESLDLKISANVITPEGDAESLPARMRLRCGTDEQEIDLRLAGGDVLLPRSSGTCAVEIMLEQPTTETAAAPQSDRTRRSAPDLRSLLSPASDVGKDTLPAKGDQ